MICVAPIYFFGLGLSNCAVFFTNKSFIMKMMVYCFSLKEHFNLQEFPEQGQL